MKEELIKYLKKFSDLDEGMLNEIAKEVPIFEYKKGTILLSQGEVPTKCYFVLKGCVRQYLLDEEGNERTTNFFTEEQSVTIYNGHTDDKESKFYLVCIEDCVLVTGNLDEEQQMYERFSSLKGVTRNILESNMGAMHDDLVAFMTSTPEERYKLLLKNRPEIIDRVPQHQLASYIGISPESLSRIKKRIKESNRD